MGFIIILGFLTGAVIGAVTVAIIIASQTLQERKKRKEKGYHPRVYINLVVVNKEEFVKEHVVSDLTKKKDSLGKVIDPLNLAPKLAGDAAKNAVSDETFCTGLAKKIAARIPGKFQQKSITATGEVCFVRGNYAVIAVTFTSLDARVILQSKGADRSKLDKAMELLSSVFGREDVEFAFESQLTDFVTTKVKENIGEDMMRKLKDEREVETDIIVKSSTDQACFFFDLTKPRDGETEGGEVTSWKLHAVDAGRL